MPTTYEKTLIIGDMFRNGVPIVPKRWGTIGHANGMMEVVSDGFRVTGDQPYNRVFAEQIMAHRSSPTRHILYVGMGNGEFAVAAIRLMKVLDPYCQSCIVDMYDWENAEGFKDFGHVDATRIFADVTGDEWLTVVSRGSLILWDVFDGLNEVYSAGVIRKLIDMGCTIVANLHGKQAKMDFIGCCNAVNIIWGSLDNGNVVAVLR